MKKLVPNKVIFHKLPDQSLLADELALQEDMDIFSFKRSHNIHKSVELITSTHEVTQVVYFLKSFQEVELLALEMKAINKANNHTPFAIILVPDTQRVNELKPLKDLGAKAFFNHEVSLETIINRLKVNLAKQNPIVDERIVIQGSHESKKEDKKQLQIEVPENKHEEFRLHLSENLDHKDINLDSGQLEVDLSSELLFKETCRLEDFTGNTIEVQIANECYVEESQKVELNIVFNYNKCRVELFLEGTVLSIQENATGQKYIVINFLSDEVDSLNNFMTLFQKRQKSIDEFMALAKGT